MLKYIIQILVLTILCQINCAFAKNNALEQLNHLLVQEEDIPQDNLIVELKNNTIYIGGNINTRLQANKVIELASTIEGVDDVNTDALIIESSKEFLTDAYITAKARGKIKYLELSSQIKPGYEIHIETTNAIVHIFGNITEKNDSTIIEKAIADIIDVKGVKTNLTYKCK